MNLRSFKHLFLAALLALPALVIPGGNASAEGMGYVDVRRLLEQAPQSQDKRNELQAEFAERNRELRGQSDLLKARADELEKNGMLMTAEELENKSNELRRLQRQVSNAQREYNEDYTRRQDQELGKLEQIITEAVIAVAQREELDVVFQRVVYASPEIDLTDQVLDELKKRRSNNE